MIEKILQLLNENNTKIQDEYFSGENWIFKATTIIKNTLAQFGKDEYDCCVSSHYLEIADQGEWIFDLVLYEMIYEGEFSRMKKIYLIVESEFSKASFGGFKEDFDKLFINNRATKLFIFRKNNEHEFEKIINYGNKAINDFEDFDVNDSIHLIYWDEIGREKNFKHYQFRKMASANTR